MDVHRLKKIISASHIRISLVVILIFALACVFIYGALTTEKGSPIAQAIIGGLLLLASFIVWFKSFRALYQIRTNQHPLIEAIEHDDQSYLLWVYNNQINTTLGSDGPVVGKSYNVSYYARGGENSEMVLRKKDSPEELISYLSRCFPQALIGYTPEHKAQVEKEIGRKI